MRARASVANPGLLAIKGVGAVVTAQLLITAGDNPDRLRRSASFAALCGTVPIPISSSRRRLWRGGDRQANAALHHIVKVRVSYDPAARAYRDTRLDKGWTVAAVFRALKRTVAQVVFQALTGHCEVPDYSDLRPAAEQRTSPSLPQRHTSASGKRESENSNSDDDPTTISPAATENGSPPLDTK